MIAPAVSAAAAASAAPGAQEVAAIPPDPPRAEIGDRVIFAGTTGFLHEYNYSRQYVWTDYGTGASVPVPGLAGVSESDIMPAGGDNIAFSGIQPPPAPSGDLAELDLASMSWTYLKAPAGTLRFTLGVFGDKVLTDDPSGAPEVLTFTSETQYTATPVTGLPAGAIGVPVRPQVGDSSAAVIRYSVSGATGYTYCLVDLSSDAAAPIPDEEPGSMTLSADSLMIYNPGTFTAQVYSRAALLNGTATAQSVTLPTPASGNYLVALAGQHVIAVSNAPQVYGAYSTMPALDVPVSGASPVTALAQAQTGTGALGQAPGGAVIVGGTGPGDWSVRELTAASGGDLADTVVLTLTGPLSNGGLTISQGLVRHIEAQPVPGSTANYLLFNHLLVPDTAGFPVDPQPWGGTLTGALPCVPDSACVFTVDGNGYGTSFLQAGTASSAVLREVIDGYSSSASLNLPSAAGAVTDASGQFVIVDGTSPAAQYVIDVGHEKILSAGPVTGAALWYSTLWRSDGPGRLQASNPATGKVAATISTGSGCAATQLQATQRWIYWTCGDSGPAGVYDLRSHTDVSVPAGPMLLGDGYLVRHDAATGGLIMYDLHTDTLAAPVTLATNVPAGPGPDDRNITWAVDKYSGDVAYVDAGDTVHVVDTGVPATAPAIGDPSGGLPPGQIYFGQYGAWNLGLEVTRPVTSWTLTVRSAATGQVVHTASGGAERARLGVGWDGYLPGGAKAYSGLYTWSLSVTAADGAPPATIPGSDLRVFCGQIPFRSIDCSGMSALLAVHRDAGTYLGEAHWYVGVPSGRLQDNGYTENWPLCSSGPRCVTAMLPFGDLNGDGYPDLLVRYRSGVLRVYHGIGQPYFNTGTVKSVRLGTGWNRYTALAAPGDLTGDGRPDLLARDGNGRLWLYAANSKGRLSPRRLIAGSWRGYRRLVGAGDLTGGGAGDLLAIDPHGVMWRFDGNGHGGFGPRARVSAGWSRFNVVLGIGDLNCDGRNDLVARDRSGVLWLYPGDGAGRFGAPVKISGGWQRYKALF